MVIFNGVIYNKHPSFLEKQYSKMEIIVGENTNSTLDDDRRLIVL